MWKPYFGSKFGISKGECDLENKVKVIKSNQLFPPPNNVYTEGL